ncbi:MAG: hypothetical protein IJ809_01575 [Clostridia bacterium]|nr:hypothetical protein [Clostridia bacterium]
MSKENLTDKEGYLSKNVSIFFLEFLFGVCVSISVIWLNFTLHVEVHFEQFIILFFGFMFSAMGFFHGCVLVKLKRRLEGMMHILLCIAFFVILEDLYIGLYKENPEPVNDIIVISFWISVFIIIISLCVLMKIESKKKLKSSHVK